MKFNLGEVLILFIVFLISTWIGGWINSIFGLSPTGEFWQTLLYTFVPFLIFYLIWKNWIQKRGS